MKTVSNRKLRNGGYYAIHKWLEKHYGKAHKCEAGAQCRGDSIMYHWAKRQGMPYEHKRENFIMLCASCHRKYDMTDSVIASIRKGHLIQAKKVAQFDREGKLIKEWNSLGDIVRLLPANKGNVNSCCNGNRKTANGYIWRFI